MDEKLYTEAEVIGYMFQAVEAYKNGYEKGRRVGGVYLAVIGGVSVALTYGITKKLKALRDSNDQNH